MNMISDKRFLLAVGFIVLGIVSRFLPHPPAFSPIMAIALFSGAFINNKKMAVIVPISIMFISDLFLGLHESMFAVYACFALMVLMGSSFLKSPKVLNVGLSALASAVIFFVVTNLSVWAFTGMYTKDMSGLMLCYEAAVPFFRNSIAGALIYSGVFFGAFSLAERFVPTLAPVKK